jgi:DNA-binding NtrC family response regulator
LPPSSPPRAPVVLLVDDLAEYRRVLARVLRVDFGLDVLECAGGMAALTILSNCPVDLVVTDEIMPQMTGSTLLHVIGERWPKTRRLLLTAYSSGELVAESPYRVLDKALTGWLVTGIIDDLARDRRRDEP